MGDITTKSNVYSADMKTDLYKTMVEYKQHSGNVVDFLLVNSSLGREGENTSPVVQEFYRKAGIKLERTPPYT